MRVGRDHQANLSNSSRTSARVLAQNRLTHRETINPTAVFVLGMGDMTPLRPSRANSKMTPHPRVGDHKEANARYIGRGNNGDGNITNTPASERGGLGNPYKLEDHTRAESVFKFAFTLLDEYSNDEALRAEIQQLTDQKLGCFCRHSDEDAPACHGDVLATWIDYLTDPQGTAVGICGSRAIYDRFGDMIGTDATALIERVLQDSTELAGMTSDIETVIHGANMGSPDAWGDQYAEDHHNATNHGIPIPDAFPNKQAPLIRNGAVVSDLATYENNLLVAFWDGNSGGTKNTIDRAREVGIPVEVVDLTDKATRKEYMTLDMVGL